MHAMKLSIILCASRTNKLLVEREDLERSIRLLEETEIKMPYTFSGVGKSSIADTINRVMTEVGLQKTCTFAHLMGRFYRDVDKLTLQKILDSLESMRFITYGTSAEGERVIVCAADSNYVKDLELQKEITD